VTLFVFGHGPGHEISDSTLYPNYSMSEAKPTRLRRGATLEVFTHRITWNLRALAETTF
jgi:hypothetical protein